MLSYEWIIFDLDGTLIDSKVDITMSLKKAFEKEGQDIEIPWDGIQIGPPILEIINHLAPNMNNNLQSRIASQFRSIYDANPCMLTQPYSGAPEAISRLTALGKKLYLATNKPKEATSQVLKKFNWESDGHFQQTVTCDFHPNGRMNKTEMVSYLIETCKLHVGTGIVVGDAPSDIWAGKNNNVCTMAVLFGYGNRMELQNCQPDFVVESVEEMFDLLK